MQDKKFEMAKTFQYPLGHSTLDIGSESSRKNKERWNPVLERFNKALRDVSREGTDASIARHQGRGQLLRKLP